MPPPKFIKTRQNGEQHYGPLEKCIYCGCTTPPLTDEHIVATQIGGFYVLEQASCTPCQRIINEEFEQPCLKKTFKDIRYRRHIGTRNLNKRPTELPVWVKVDWRPGDKTPEPPRNEADDGWEVRSVKYGQHPTSLAMVRLKTPGILRGLSPQQSLADWEGDWWRYVEPPEQNDAIKSPMYVSGVFDTLLFARMLAKMAHGAAVQSYGLDGFKPFLRDIILGVDLSKTAYLIGGYTEKLLPGPDHLFLATMQLETAGIIYVAVAMRLFANLAPFHDLEDGAPAYTAIVGEYLKN
jgi:hypothetical protein